MHFDQVIKEEVVGEQDSPKNSFVAKDNHNLLANQIKSADYEEGDNENDRLNNNMGSGTNEDEANPGYGKGEMPLDLFLESTYEEGKKSSLDAITVFRPKVERILAKLKDGD